MGETNGVCFSEFFFRMLSVSVLTRVGEQSNMCKWAGIALSALSRSQCPDRFDSKMRLLS
jgi:hypothetical protein